MALKHHYITNRIRELLIGNSRFLIQNFLGKLLCYKDEKESCLFVGEITETLDLSNLGRPMASQIKDNYSESSSAYFLKQRR